MCMKICIHIYVHIYIYIYIYVHIYIYICRSIHIHIYIYICIAISAQDAGNSTLVVHKRSDCQTIVVVERSSTFSYCNVVNHQLLRLLSTNILVHKSLAMN